LPLAKTTTDSVLGKQSTQAYLPGNPLAGCHVLVLDDDVAVLEGMKGLLTRWGCQVTTSSSPDEMRAKLAATAQKVELLIVDYRLPNNVSGIEVARDLQTHLGYPVAVMIITGDTGPDRLREADASGYPLLHKPVEPAKLRSTLQYLANKLNTGNL
jgi:CheY-like chemotaxis protein